MPQSGMTSDVVRPVTRLRGEIRQIREEIEGIRSLVKRLNAVQVIEVPLPRLTAVAQEVKVLFPEPMPSDAYGVCFEFTHGAQLLGNVQAATKVGTRTPAGFTVLLKATGLVSIGEATLKATVIHP